MSASSYPSRQLVRLIGGLLLLLLAAGFGSPVLAATGTCGSATSQGADGPADYATYCWLDLSGYTGGTQAFTISLTGGSTLSFTLSITGGAITASTIPTWTGAAFGQAAFVGVPGKPALYQTANGSTTTVTLSSITLTLGSGGTVPYAIVAADAESTNAGETLSFNASGTTPWTLLSTMENIGSTTLPTLGGVGTQTVTETGVNGTVGAYAFSNVGSPTQITATMVGSGLQGIAFAVKFHAADLTIGSSHSGNFTTGTTGTYSLTVTNNGPDSYTTSNTITVTDTLPAGLSYTSASGSAWTCGAAGQVVTCSTNANLASGASLPVITVNASVGNTTANSITNSATVSTSPNYDYNSANNTATDVTTVLYATDVQITNTNATSFTVGTDGTYTLTAKDNGPLAANGTTTVTETLPATETFVSAAGTGWTCGAVGQVVTCTSTTAMASGASLPAISLTVLVSTSAPSTVSTTATVSNSLVSDTNSGNNSSIDNATVTSPNYINTTKTVVDVTQSPTINGDTLEYTITVIDSAGQAGFNLEVTDTLDSDLGTPTIVTCPTGATCSVAGTTITVTGIDVAANSTATIVYDATVTGSVGDEVENTATVTGGTTSPDTATATPVQITNPSPTGAKTLYFLTAGITGTSGFFHRVPNTGASATAKNDNIATNGGNVIWDLKYETAGATTITGNVVANMYIGYGSTQNRNGTRSISVSLSNGTTSITGSNTNCNPTSSTTPTLCQVTLSNTSFSVPAGTLLKMTLTNNTTSSNRLTIAFFPEEATTRVSDMTFTINPAITVDSVNFYSVAYPSTSTLAQYPPGSPTTTVYIRTVVSDPFGCFDLNYAGGGTPANPSVTFGLTDANGTVQLPTTTSLMGDEVTSCTAPAIGSAYVPSITFEYPYSLTGSAVQGYWAATVTGREGTEQVAANNSISSGTFRVGYLPSLLIVKSVTILSDPVNGTTMPRALPSGVAQYNIVVSNTGKGTASNMYVTDPIPTNVSFVVGSQSFTDGSPTSGLPTPTFSYDNSSCAGTFTYSPSGTADPNVKCIKATFNPAINMNGQTATAPSFTVSFKVQVN